MESCFRKPEIEKGFQFSLTTKKHLLDAHCVSTDNFKHNKDKWLVDLEIFNHCNPQIWKDIFNVY